MNLNNSNSDYQDISNSDYNKHWSFSNFNRQLITANAINEYQKEVDKSIRVVEIAAGDSKIYDIMRNFKTDFKSWRKYDFNEKYKDCIRIDVTSEQFEEEIKIDKPDVIICEEFIEHISREKVDKLLEVCYNSISENGLLILTTPTPPFSKEYEDRVWPDDHITEFSDYQAYSMINKYFKVEKKIGWSLEKREYNDLLEKDDYVRKIYCKLKNAFPESYIRAIISSLVDNSYNRQMLYICKRRRAIVKC